jgi:hypothetical protein
MFALVGSIFKTVFYAFLLHHHLKKNHHEKYTELLINATYRLIYLYSKGQIYLYKMNKHIHKLIEKTSLQHPELYNLIKKYIESIKENKRNTVEYILNDTCVGVFPLDDINLHKEIDYDFMIINEKLRENKYVNKRIVGKKDKWTNVFEESNIKFMLIEILVNNKIIKVDFKTDKYNFYIVNNVFNETFLKYFLKTYYFDEVKESILDDATIVVLDEDINKISYQINTDYIHITKTNYFRKTDIITED